MTPGRQVVDTSFEIDSLYLIEEINHRVANEYAHAIALLTTATLRSGNIEARQAITSVKERLRAYADAHQALLLPLGSDKISLCDYVSHICSTALDGSLAGKGVTITLQSDDVWLPARDCWRIGLIIAELVSNAYRHGFSGGAGTIAIALRRVRENLCCEVRDDGRGAADPAMGRGRGVLRSIASDLGGSIDWSFASNGTVVQLKVPY